MITGRTETRYTSEDCQAMRQFMADHDDSWTRKTPVCRVTTLMSVNGFIQLMCVCGACLGVEVEK